MVLHLPYNATLTKQGDTWGISSLSGA